MGLMPVVSVLVHDAVACPEQAAVALSTSDCSAGDVLST